MGCHSSVSPSPTTMKLPAGVGVGVMSPTQIALPRIVLCSMPPSPSSRSSADISSECTHYSRVTEDRRREPYPRRRMTPCTSSPLAPQAPVVPPGPLVVALSDIVQEQNHTTPTPELASLNKPNMARSPSEVDRPRPLPMWNFPIRRADTTSVTPLI